MAQSRRSTSTTRTKETAVSQISAQPILFPDEDQQAYDTFRNGLLSDLAPSTPYECVLADNLVSVDWEAIRYRRLRDQLILQNARDVVVQLLKKPTEPRDIFDFEPLPGPSDQERTFAAGLISGNSSRRAEVEKALQKRGHSIDGVMAQAYERVHEKILHIERWLADAEKRRRRLRQDYDDLRASRAQSIDTAAE